MNELSNNLLSAPTSLVPEKQTEELNWVKKNKTNENDKKKTYDCRLAVLAAEPKAVLVLTSFFYR